ncbi:AraC family transcriptional regulator [Flavobacterium jejuense]|uniref:AraC family transcriptional regulator n=1 Tax=Flavobacterium jejuense TaxID=1544455 RepID=A0ABX0IY27_9FLAO|nr:GyrI-like domain-containing protein [Flavobacterium jejuense]NHN26921.1 AraC family transcriptional regulator [Flavobacterium jejuense]
MNEEYIKRINAVFEYIDANLDSELALETLSQIAFYSPFHFHRIFKMITNETLNNYIGRKRIEKAAALLLHKKDIAISDLVTQLGFTSSSTFTRAFKKYYGQSPTAFRKSNPHKFSKISQLNSKNGQIETNYDTYICNIINLKKWTTMHANIAIKEMPKQDLAYVTHIGVEGLETAFYKIIKWATPRNILENPTSKIIRVFHDSFKITPPEKVRMSIGITLNQPIAVEGEIGLTQIEKGKFIVGRYEIEPVDFEKAWTGLFIWMNENGYTKAAANPFEIYHNNFTEHPEKKCIVDLCIPI